MEHQALVSTYMQHCVQHGKPSTIEAFCNKSSLSVGEVKPYFSSILSLEQGVFLHMFTYTKALLAQDAQELNSEFQTQVLAFYFTFFELLSANREYVYQALTEGGLDIANVYKLIPLSKEIKAFFVSKSDFNFGPLSILSAIPKTLLGEIMWWQFLSILKFWLEDTSEHFEKTDIFIEKSVAAQHEVLGLLRWHHLVDWGKFMFQESRPK